MGFPLEKGKFCRGKYRSSQAAFFRIKLKDGCDANPEVMESAPARGWTIRGSARTVEMAKRDTTLAEVVGGHFQGNVVARKNADVMLAHLSAAVGDQLVTIFKRNPVARVREDLIYNAAHFEQLFFGHSSPFQVSRTIQSEQHEDLTDWAW
jgi:hypothetical protein